MDNNRNEKFKTLTVTVFPIRNESCVTVFRETTCITDIFPREWIGRIFPDYPFSLCEDASCGDKWKLSCLVNEQNFPRENILKHFAVPFVRAFAEFDGGGKRFLTSDMTVSVKIDSYMHALGLRLETNRSSFAWVLCLKYPGIDTQRDDLSSLCWETLSQFQEPEAK